VKTKKRFRSLPTSPNILHTNRMSVRLQTVVIPVVQFAVQEQSLYISCRLLKDAVTKNALQEHISDSCLQVNWTMRSTGGHKTGGGRLNVNVSAYMLSRNASSWIYYRLNCTLFAH